MYDTCMHFCAVLLCRTQAGRPCSRTAGGTIPRARSSQASPGRRMKMQRRKTLKSGGAGEALQGHQDDCACVKFATRVGITVGTGNTVPGRRECSPGWWRAGRRRRPPEEAGGRPRRLAGRTARGVGRSIENKGTAAGELFSRGERLHFAESRHELSDEEERRPRCGRGDGSAGHGGGGRLGDGDLHVVRGC